MFGIHFSDIQIDKLFVPERAWENLPFVLQGVPLTLLVAVLGMILD